MPFKWPGKGNTGAVTKVTTKDNGKPGKTPTSNQALLTVAAELDPEDELGRRMANAKPPDRLKPAAELPPPRIPLNEDIAEAKVLLAEAKELKDRPAAEQKARMPTIYREIVRLCGFTPAQIRHYSVQGQIPTPDELFMRLQATVTLGELVYLLHSRMGMQISFGPDNRTTKDLTDSANMFTPTVVFLRPLPVRSDPLEFEVATPKVSQ